MPSKKKRRINNDYIFFSFSRKPRHQEWHIQKSFFDWLALYPEIREVSFSVPNDGASRTAKETVHLKMTGLTPGAPDVLIMYPCGEFHGLVIEFKTPTGCLSDRQKIMLKNLSEKGYKVKVCRSLDDGIETVKQYFSCLNPRWNA